MLEALKEKVFHANLELVKHGLVSSPGAMFRPSTVRRDW